ncbi:MAG: hypothetical protein ABMB14_11540, partial [Myxococcota bacterium]
SPGDGPRSRLGAAGGAATGALLAMPVALGIGAIGGLAIGVIATWLLKPADVVERARPPTADELAAACQVEAQADELTTAQAKVAELERDVATRERRVKELEAQMQQRSERGKEFVAEYERMKSELADAKQKLEIAEQEKSHLLEQLRQTEEELATTTKQRDVAREDALFNKWQDFLKNAQLEICDKGNRKKLGNCRETVEATLALDARRDAFSHCIRSGQATPMLQERKNESEPLPAFAEMIDEEQKQTKGWMVIFCDPTLPERDDVPLAASHLPD